jgi:hypothetical protein
MMALPDDPRGPYGDYRRPGSPQSDGGAPRQQSILTEAEMQSLACVVVSVWMFIFFGGIAEWKAKVPGRAKDDGHVAAACEQGYYWCTTCAPGWLQAGRGCYAHLEDLPAVQVGAALGGTFYFVLIVLTQVAGITCEVMLINRVRTVLVRLVPTVAPTSRPRAPESAVSIPVRSCCMESSFVRCVALHCL